MVKNMRREKKGRNYLSLLGAVVCSALLTACGGKGEDITVSDADSEAEIIVSDIDSGDENRESTTAGNNSMETETEENTQSDTDAKDERDIFDTASEDEVQEPIPDDNGWLEIYAEGDSISLSDDMLVGKVTTEDILHDTPILYDRAIIDDFVFEWLLLGDKNDKDISSYDGVLIISKQNDPENAQVLHKQQYKWEGWPVSLQSKFVYMDVNFDDVPDLLICTGHHGNQGFVTYYCFLQTDAGFVDAPTFTGISNPAVDTENKMILSQWRNWAASHSWAEYKYQDNAYVLDRELCEEAVGYDEDGNDIWAWTVNGEEIGRSDELSKSEIEDLIYNENSEWRILDDRWRTIYNSGLNADFSIYSEP